MVDFSTISFRDLINGLGDFVGETPVHFTPKAELNPENYVSFVFIGKEEADAINTMVINADGSKAQEGDEVHKNGHYYMKEAAFFSASQVAPAEKTA